MTEAEDKKTVTVAIATFNSEKLLREVIKGVRSQNYSQDLINILIVDGGSSDKTIEISREYGCQIIMNPRVEPVYAKFLAYKEAKTDFLMFLDHDEVLENNFSFDTRIHILTNNEAVKAVIGSGYKTPKGVSIVNDYINEFGDPFSAFRYNLSKDHRFFCAQMKQRYKAVKETDKALFFNFKGFYDLPIIELVAGGALIDLNFFKAQFPETLEASSYLPHLFYKMIEKKGWLSICKNDVIVHFSSENVGNYLKKIKWRIKNNIFFEDMAKSGFSERERFERSIYLKIKKYLFIPYAFSFIAPIYTSFYLVLSRKRLSYFIHFPLVIYTASSILFYFLFRLFGHSPRLTSYDSKKEVEIGR